MYFVTQAIKKYRICLLSRCIAPQSFHSMITTNQRIRLQHIQAFMFSMSLPRFRILRYMHLKILLKPVRLKGWKNAIEPTWQPFRSMRLIWKSIAGKLR